MPDIFEAKTYIEIVSCSDDEVILKDTRHDGILKIKCLGDLKGTTICSEIQHAFIYGNLLLRIKRENTFFCKEAFDLSGNVQIHNVVLIDPILEDASLTNVELPNTELSVRFASLEDVPLYKRPKKITLAYGLYTGSDLCGSLDINRINGSNVRA